MKTKRVKSYEVQVIFDAGSRQISFSGDWDADGVEVTRGIQLIHFTLETVNADAPGAVATFQSYPLHWDEAGADAEPLSLGRWFDATHCTLAVNVPGGPTKLSFIVTVTYAGKPYASAAAVSPDSSWSMAFSAPPVGQPVEHAESSTKEGLLAHLRALESRLYSQEVVAAVKEKLKDQPEQQMAFAQSRLHLTATIAKVNAALLGEIREGLQAQAGALQQGIDGLSSSLGRLEGAVGWAKAVNGVINTLGKIVALV